MFSAAALFAGHRLPEVLSGLPRDDAHPHPGVYPDSCSPHAWSASAVVALIQALLALRPAAPLRTISIRTCRSGCRTSCWRACGSAGAPWT
ncbi:hypothetical protein AB0J51_23090 [Micromonospora echinofusca]|uniref:hypothetical protein n=1 Tax=Micromonospora echinofusca TaxID=47858 RepID=UPI003441CB46